MTHKNYIPQEPSFIDLKQMAMCINKVISISEHTFNKEHVYKIKDEVGLYTAKELQYRLCN